MNKYLEASRETVKSHQTIGIADTIYLHELLAVLLGEEAEPGLCGRLAKNHLDTLVTMNTVDLEREGVSSVKALELVANFMLVQKFVSEPEEKTTLYPIRSPQNIVKYLNPYGAKLEKQVVLLMLNDYSEVIDKKLILTGSFNEFSIHPRQIFREAFKKSAAAIILCHTQPEYDSTIEQADVELCRKMKEAGYLTGIELIDYVVVATSGWTSFKEQGYL